MSQVSKIEGACVQVECMVLGMLSNNVYVISDGKSNIVVDPSCKADKILEAIGQKTISHILLTHYHFDHIGAAQKLRDATGACVVAGKLDAPLITGEVALTNSHERYNTCQVDLVVDDGDDLMIGSMKWHVIHTPGHSPGSVCYYLDKQFGANHQGSCVLVAGDTLFCGVTGRTDFEDGSEEDLIASMQKLKALPDNTLVLPGHGDYTTILDERSNVFLRY